MTNVRTQTYSTLKDDVKRSVQHNVYTRDAALRFQTIDIRFLKNRHCLKSKISPYLRKFAFCVSYIAELA